MGYIVSFDTSETYNWGHHSHILKFPSPSLKKWAFLIISRNEDFKNCYNDPISILIYILRCQKTPDQAVKGVLDYLRFSVLTINICFGFLYRSLANAGVAGIAHLDLTVLSL